MSQRKQEVRDSFQKGAKNYNIVAFTRSLGTQYEDYVESKLTIEKNSKYIQGNILDLGVGTGRFAQRLMKQETNIFGVDISPAMLKTALKKIDRHKVNFIVADIEHLPFKSDYFDLVISFRVIKYLPDPSTVAKEAYRVLKEGRVLIVEMPNKNVLYVEVPLLITRFLKFIGIKDTPLKYYLIINFVTLKEMTNILQNSGFRLVNVLTTLRLPHPVYERASSELRVTILKNVEKGLSQILPPTAFSRSYIFCCQKLNSHKQVKVSD